jgi:uncharacterized alkaline shock family protein YloU
MIEIARTPLGSISLEPKALDQVVRDAAETVDGAYVARSGIDISIADAGAAAVAVSVTAPRGAVLPELGKLVQERIAAALIGLLEAPPTRIDVTIEAIDA